MVLTPLSAAFEGEKRSWDFGVFTASCVCFVRVKVCVRSAHTLRHKNKQLWIGHTAEIGHFFIPLDGPATRHFI